MNKQEISEIVKNKHLPFLARVFPQERPIQIKGMAAWGSAGEGKWAILSKIEEAPIDIIISTRKILLRIYISPDQGFEIGGTIEREGVEAENVDTFLKGLKTFVINKGYNFKELTTTKVPPALPAPMAEDELTESFECFITEIDDDVAYVTLVDDVGEKSYMEIPVEDLKKNKIEHKPGAIFSFLFKRRGEWEAVELSPIERSPMKRSEIDDLINYYKEKYGDV